MSEGEGAHLGWGMAHPGSREAEGEGGEGFYIRPKRQARRFTCILRGAENLEEVELPLPMPLWRVGVAALSSREAG